MTRPQIRDENRKSAPRMTHGLQVLALMVDGGLMTCPRAEKALQISPKYSRNVVCRLASQKLVEQVSAKGYGISATYRITPLGRARVFAAQMGPDSVDQAEDEADELAERAVAQARVEINLANARTSVPNSVFALGAVRSAPARGLTSADAVRGRVRAEGATA